MAWARSYAGRISGNEHSAWGARDWSVARTADQRSLGRSLDTTTGDCDFVGIPGRGGWLCAPGSIEPSLASEPLRDARAFRQFAGLGVLDHTVATAKRR